jgi:hypothetical protein
VVREEMAYSILELIMQVVAREEMVTAIKTRELLVV